MPAIIAGEYVYEVTPADRLWLLRAVQQEGRPQNGVAQALVNGFAYEHARGNYPTMTAFVRAYASPVNPQWFPEGKKFQAAHAANPQKYSLEAAQRRRDLHSTRTVFDRGTHAAVERALSRGPVDVPRATTDYGAPWLDASHKYTRTLPAPGPKSGVNAFWTRAPHWTGYVVAGATSAAPVAGILLVALVGLAYALRGA